MNSFTMEYPCHGPDEMRWFVASCLPMSGDNAVVVHFDVTPQKLAEQTLSDVATHDYLTGLFNRRGLDTQLALQREAATRTGHSLIAVMIDIDDFKHINDSLGMAAGDVVLAAVARRLEHAMRPNDVLARIGGDEFMVLLPEVRPIEATVVAERLRLAVSGRPIAISNTTTELTISLAIAQLDDRLLTLEQVLDRTRHALRASKDAGKNRVTSAVVTDDGDVSSGFAGEVRTILTTTDRLSSVFQPLVDLASLTVVGYELLVRDTAPPHVSPSMMFQQAAESGILTPLDQRCLALALDSVKLVDPAAICHINIYPSTLLELSPEMFDTLFARPDAARLCIELSEQQIIGDPTYLLPALEKLRSFGVKIALDDVGFGRTALESLIVLEPEVVKIDRIYVDGVSEDVVRQGWLRRLARSAHSLDATLVAEGVEQLADVAALQELGIEMAQGFLYGRPAPANQVLPLGALRRPIASAAKHTGDRRSD